MEEENIQVPIWILKEIHNALRLTANIYHCSERETCWQRDVMEAYNMTSQLLENGKYKYSTSHRLGYRQTPEK